jgi:hypothetical protein
MNYAFLAGVAVCAWGAWRLALGQTRPPPLPSLGEYQVSITFPPARSLPRRGQTP